MKINSGRWNPNGEGVTAQRVAAGIRSEPAKFVGEIPDEAIFVAITGREGSYRAKKDADRILEQIGVEIAYTHDATDTEIEVEFLLIEDADHHAELFDGLVQYVDNVYPLPEEEEQEELSETEEEEEVTSF